MLTLVAKIGEDEFNARLDSIFTLSQPKIFSGGTEVGAFAGLKTLYNHGNQPCLHISWLFNEANRPSMTQKWVRAILDDFYGTDGIHGYGYGQDEDQGQLGAWYVISSMGLFSVTGLNDINPVFSLGSRFSTESPFVLATNTILANVSSLPAMNNPSKHCPRMMRYMCRNIDSMAGKSQTRKSLLPMWLRGAG